MKTIVLTEAQHAHYSKLSGEGAEAFLAKSASDRDAIVKAAADADPIVFKGESGIEVRKSHGDLVLQLAKQNDAMAKAAKEQADAIAKAKADLETEQLTKRAAADIGNLAGETAHKVAALRALDSITDQAAREGAIRMLKSADEFAKAANKAPGVNPETPAPDGPKAQFDALVAKHATDNKVDERTARLAVVKTAEGRALYTEIENLRKRNALPAAR